MPDNGTTTGPGNRRRARSNRRLTITDPAPSPYLADVSLAVLRSYRQQLMDEDDKVSYWCRLAHSRIEVLEAASHTDVSLSLKDLVRVLGDTGTGHTRTALAEVRAAVPLPGLPALAEMWVAGIDPQDHGAVVEAVARIRVAELQLTDYRHALQERISEATGELISRYRDDPASTLIALRKWPERRSAMERAQRV